VDENKLLGIIRSHAYSKKLFDLLRAMIKTVGRGNQPIGELLSGTLFFANLPPTVKDYLHGHVTAWAVFELLLALPTTQREILAMLGLGPSIARAVVQPNIMPVDEAILYAENDAYTGNRYFSADIGGRRSSLGGVEPDGSIHIARNVTVHGRVYGSHFPLDFGRFNNHRPAIVLQDHRERPGEETTYFLFICAACGGIFAFDSPQPNMHPMDPYMPNYGDGRPTGYVCSRCYTPKEKRDE
jgi:hypothetical protein